MDAIRIEHVAIWVRDLEGMCHFYVAMLGAKSGAPYHNPRNGFRSMFLSFGDGARVELMSQSGQVEDRSEASRARLRTPGTPAWHEGGSGRDRRAS